jgi:type I restriction enzyme S subunit
MPTKTKNTPSLRFPEFKGEWEQKKLGEVGDVKMCRRIFNEETLPIGDIPFYKIGSFGKNADAYISKELYLDYRQRFSFPKKGDVLISAAGTIGRIVVYNGEDAYYQDSNIVWIANDNSTISNEFLFCILQIVKYNTEGGTIQRLYNSILKSTKFSCPSLPEQQKIASFLTAVDERIQQLKEQKELLEQYKKGLMQKIFSQELRFKDDKGKIFSDWEEKELGDCLDYIQPTNFLVSSTEYDNRYEIPVLTAGKTFILGYTNETKGIFKSPLPVIIFDDFTTATQFVDFPFKAKSSAMKILIAKENMNIKFMFEAMRMMNYEIGGHERHWISKFSPKSILIPSYAEQTKIANFLSAIDDKIMKVAEALEATQQWKKGLLQKLFI